MQAMKVELALDHILPKLMAKRGIPTYQTAVMTIVLEKGVTAQSSFKYNAGNEYLFVVDDLAQGIRIKSSNGYYDANSPFGGEREELHTGQFMLENFSATQQVVQLVKVQPC